MNRTYTLRLGDFTEDAKVKYINIISVSYITLVYNNINIESSIVPVESLDSLYVSTNNDGEAVGTIKYTLSYDGVHFSEECTLTVVFPTIVEDSTCHKNNANILKHILFNGDLDVCTTISALLNGGLVSETDRPIIVPLFVGREDLPDSVKLKLSKVSIIPAPGTQIFIMDNGQAVEVSNEIPLSTVDLVAVLIRNHKAYSNDISLTVKDSVGDNHYISLGDIKIGNQTYDKFWKEIYEKTFYNQDEVDHE